MDEVKYPVKEKIIIEGLYCLKFNVEPYGVSRNLLTEILSYRCYDSGYDEIAAGFLPDNIKYLTHTHSIYIAAINGHLNLAYKIRDILTTLQSDRSNTDKLIYGALAEGGHLKYVKQIYMKYQSNEFYTDDEKHKFTRLLLRNAVKGNSIETVRYCYERLIDIHRITCKNCLHISDTPCQLNTLYVTAIAISIIEMNDKNSSIEAYICETLHNVALNAGWYYKIDNLDFLLTKIKELGQTHLIPIIKQKILYRLELCQHTSRNSIKLQRMLEFIRDYQI